MLYMIFAISLKMAIFVKIFDIFPQKWQFRFKMKILKFLGNQHRSKVPIPIVGFSSDMLKLYFYQGILEYDVFIQFSLFSFILGTKTHWIFWRAPEHVLLVVLFVHAFHSFFKLRVVNINRATFISGFLDCHSIH